MKFGYFTFRELTRVMVKFHYLYQLLIAKRAK
jgi:hypothetical protein